jgi:hypothetical protein
MNIRTLQRQIERRIRALEEERREELGLEPNATEAEEAEAFDAYWEDATSSDYEADDQREGEIEGLRWVLRLLGAPTAAR